MPIFIVFICLFFFFAILYLFIGWRTFTEFTNRNARKKEVLEQEGAGTHRSFIEEKKPELLHLKTRDNVTLCGHLLRAENPRGSTVLLLHGYLGNGIDHMGMFVPFYLEQGFDVFLPDLRAHGNSGGTYIGFGKTDADDCVQWLNYLTALYPKTQNFLLHGVSMGGATACIASSHDALPKNVRGVVSDCAFSSCKEQFTHSLHYVTPIPANILLPAANFWCKRLAGYDLYKASASEAVKRSTLPFFFIHGMCDTFVPTEMVHTLAEACPDPHKTVFLVPDTKHFLSYTNATQEYQARLKDFFARAGV